MVSKALYVRLEAKPGKETEVEQFLKGAFTAGASRTRDHSLVSLSVWGPSTFWNF